jgi:hypothetical protein
VPPFWRETRRKQALGRGRRLIVVRSALIALFATSNRLPAIYPVRDFAREGGLARIYCRFGAADAHTMDPANFM